MNYRADIDGLRALAVVPVVFYHAGVPGFSGGFAGVDVFFVISGYLIAKLIWSDIQAGTFSLAEFYARRARRILPALFVVAATTFMIAALLFVPEDLDDLSASLVATVLFAANVYFWHETDYFALDAAGRPLLHAWSLGVEEQFYIVFPALLIWLARAAPSRAGMAVIFIGCSSLLLSAVMLGAWPTATFFLLPARAWELLLGAVLGMGLLAPPGRVQAGLAALLGLLLLGLAFTQLDHATPFPGLFAVLPCLGAALVIWAGGAPGAPDLVTRGLSLRPLVGLGLISYSLYLWHWPLLVFARYWRDRPLDAAATITVLVLSVLLALASWRWVEQPFRHRGGQAGRSRITGSLALHTALACGSILVAAGLAGMLSDGLPQRLQPQARAFAEVARDRSSGQCKFNSSRTEITVEDFCIIGTQRAGVPDFFVWGDSHASAALPAIRTAAEKAGGWGVMIWQPGCLPMLGVSRPHEADGPQCLRFNSAVAAYLATTHVANVILVARWNQTLLGHPAIDAANRKSEILVTDAESRAPSRSESIAASLRGLERTLSSIAANDRKAAPAERKIWFVEQMPFAGFDVPKRLVRSAMRAEASPDQSADFDEGIRRKRAAMALVAPVLDRYGVDVIDPWPALCAGTRCRIAKAGRSLYRDEDHISAIGAVEVAPAFEAATRPR